MQKSLDQKLAAIHADPSGCREFIIADAKDADMGFGIPATGVKGQTADGKPVYKTLAEYRDQIRQVIAQGVVDIVLMSGSTSEQLMLNERLFDHSHITPAVRANDATDVHVMRHSRIPESAARPFRTSNLDHLQCGHLGCTVEERRRGPDLGLYSVTFNNNLDDDLRTLEAFKTFREEAEAKQFRYFLEVFNPNLPDVLPSDELPRFLNDAIARSLAGVPQAGRPAFLKIVYQGPEALQELVHFDPQLVVGVLGGAAGTTRDAFQLIHDAQQNGAKVALFGRKINQAEHQLAFIEFLRRIVEHQISPAEAVRAYHGVLQNLNLKPHRSLEEDSQITAQEMSYHTSGTTSKTISVPGKSSVSVVKPSADQTAPNFAAMTSEQRLQYHQARLNQQYPR